MRNLSKEQRIENLVRLGYRPNEAEFVCLAALNSGYFVRRQFVSFLGKKSGWLDEVFLSRAKAMHHVAMSSLARNRVLYHFKSHPLFTALGESNNRNRRTHETFTIKTRLMILDFVLAHLQNRFMSTEQEKIQFFCDVLHLDSSHFPSKLYRSASQSGSTRRFFVDKMPIFVDTHDLVPVPSFCYVDAGSHGSEGFKTYLGEYRTLFARLPQYRLVYVAATSSNLADVERIFKREVGTRGAPVDPAITRLLGYFSDRQRFDRRDLAGFDQGKLIQFRQDRLEFSDSDSERLFDRWKTGGDEAIIALLAPESHSRPRSSATFSAHVMDFDYRLFGSLFDGNYTID